MNSRWCAFVIVALLSIARSASAQTDFVGVRATGMGDAMRATATGASGPLLNPAAMSLNRGYTIEGQYGLRVEDLTHQVHLSIVDSVTSRVAAGLFYSYIYGSPKVGFDWAGGRIEAATLNRTGHVAGLSLSMPFGDKFMMGLTAKYMKIDTYAPLPKGTTPETLRIDGINGVTFDFAMLVRLGKFHITAIGYNLWDHGTRETPTSLGVAVAFLPTPGLTINVDGIANFTGNKNVTYDPATDKTTLTNRTTGRIGVGMEWAIKQKVPLRLGYNFDSNLTASYLSFGLGYLSQSFGIDAAYRAKVSGGIENYVVLGIRIFIN